MVPLKSPSVKLEDVSTRLRRAGPDIFHLLVCQRLARRNAALRDPRRAVIPVRPILKLQRKHALVKESLEWHQFSHKPVPMYTRSIWEVILYLDD